eukprot:14716568-Alexandrium_andersonii.AAC.1
MNSAAHLAATDARSAAGAPTSTIRAEARRPKSRAAHSGAPCGRASLLCGASARAGAGACCMVFCVSR